ncbi:hypothetical protein Bbelb_176290 [Branchiostoma belcheri]|nr:hypothetical protein Bbelb_176290 [Branchiostoma belcheri]
MFGCSHKSSKQSGRTVRRDSRDCLQGQRGPRRREFQTWVMALANEKDVVAYLDYIRGDPRERLLTNALITCSEEVDFNYETPPKKGTFTSSWKDSVAGWGSVPPNTFSLPTGSGKGSPVSNWTTSR